MSRGLIVHVCPLVYRTQILLSSKSNQNPNPNPNHTPMASSKLISSSMSRSSDLSLRPKLKPQPPIAAAPKTVDEVWQDIVSGEDSRRGGCKEEQPLPDEMMTLEDFLARAVDETDVKDFSLAPLPPENNELFTGGGLSGGLSGGLFGFDQIGKMEESIVDQIGIASGSGGGEIGGGNGRGREKRPRAVMEPLDKAAQQRQRRMIKNRESAARSRERKQAYQVELETLAVKLEEENERLVREQAERTEERLKQLMENNKPVAEKRRPSRVLRRVRSMQW